MTSKLRLRAAVAACAILASGYASAADAPPIAAPAPVADNCNASISFPSYGGVIKANPDPYCVGSPVGDIYVGGALSGYAYHYSKPLPSIYAPAVPGIDNDRSGRVDVLNALAVIQKADGPFQFVAIAGLYAVPVLGLPTFSSVDQTDLLYGPVPVAFGKWQISDEWSVQGGRMMTLIGSESMFSFQRLNITGGLLYNQENLINQGVQVNYASGPWAVSFAATDGAFSGEINWVTGSISYKLDDTSAIGVNGGTHFSSFNSALRSPHFQYATPLTVQNSSIISANYTYANGPWIITPWIQYTNVERNAAFGLAGAETFGAALLASYSFNDNFHLAGRGEYIEQSGSKTNPLGQTSVLYGAGSSAYSLTITPTFTWDRYFLRGEFSHVQLTNFQPGLGFGRFGTAGQQQRYMLETGITF